MANTIHTLSDDNSSQKLIDFVRKIVQDSRQMRYTGSVSIRIVFKDGGLRSCEQEIKNLICLD